MGHGDLSGSTADAPGSLHGPMCAPAVSGLHLLPVWCPVQQVMGPQHWGKARVTKGLSPVKVQAQDEEIPFCNLQNAQWLFSLLMKPLLILQNP